MNKMKAVAGGTKTTHASKRPSEVLWGAAQYLRIYGWRKYARGDHLGPRCISGAMFSANGSGQSNPHLVPGYKYIEDVCGIPRAIGIFNDEHCETVDDACAALEIAGDIAAAKGR